MLPTQGDVHVNQPLSNISVAFLQKQEGFVADKVFPNIPVAKQSDLYYTYDRGYFNRSEMKVRAPGAESAGAGYTVSTTSYYAHVYSLHHDIPDQRRANTDAVLDADREATELLSLQALIKREKLWVSKFFTTSLWTLTDQTGVASGPAANQFVQWNDASSTPIEFIRARKTLLLQSTGMMPNTFVMGQQVADALMDHPDIIDRIKYGQTTGGPAFQGLTALAAILGIERVFVMQAVENTAKEGATNSHSFIGGKHALLCYAAPNPGLMTPSAGYTFSWNGLLGSGALGSRMKKFRMEALASDRVEIDMAFDQKLISADLGQFFASAVA